MQTVVPRVQFLRDRSDYATVSYDHGHPSGNDVPENLKTHSIERVVDLESVIDVSSEFEESIALTRDG